jgi:cytoskeletal protein RodZ
MHLTLGKTLKNAREASTLTIDDVVNSAKIPRDVIIALESDNIDYFDCPLYAQSFLKQYGACLEFDVKPWLAHFAPKATTQPREIYHATDMDKLKEGAKECFHRTKKWFAGSKPLLIIICVLLTMILVYEINQNFDRDPPVKSDRIKTPPAAEKNPTEIEIPKPDHGDQLSNELEPPQRAIIIELPPQP